MYKKSQDNNYGHDHEYCSWPTVKQVSLVYLKIFIQHNLNCKKDYSIIQYHIWSKTSSKK